MTFNSMAARAGLWLVVAALAGCAHDGGNASRQQVSSRAQASARIHTELAAQYYERSQFGVALEELNTALQADPGYAPAYSMRGLVHMQLRENEQADRDFLKSLKLDSNNAEGHNNYGWFLCQQGRELDSIEHFMTALENPLYQTPEKAYLNAGLCSRKGGKLEDAGRHLQKALRLVPNMPDALLGMADLSYANGDFAGAKSYFERFSRSTSLPLTAANLLLAVRIERKLGDRAAEEGYAEQLRTRFPDARETQVIRRR